MIDLDGDNDDGDDDADDAGWTEQINCDDYNGNNDENSIVSPNFWSFYHPPGGKFINRAQVLGLNFRTPPGPKR